MNWVASPVGLCKQNYFSVFCFRLYLPFYCALLLVDLYQQHYEPGFL